MKQSLKCCALKAHHKTNKIFKLNTNETLEAFKDASFFMKGKRYEKTNT